MKIRYVTGIHGNEIAPILALASLGKRQLVANPLGVAKRMRYVEKDMNASFGLESGEYEVRRAKEVLREIDGREVVIDLHTFRGQSDPFVIVVDKKMLRLAARLGMEKVVYMKFNPKQGHALINYRQGVSVELGQHDDYERVFSRVKRMVRRLEDDLEDEIEIYEVIGKYEQEGDYRNFVKNVDGYYPVLASKKAFEIHGWYALKARKVNYEL